MLYINFNTFVDIIILQQPGAALSHTHRLCVYCHSGCTGLLSVRRGPGLRGAESPVTLWPTHWPQAVEPHTLTYRYTLCRRWNCRECYVAMVTGSDVTTLTWKRDGRNVVYSLKTSVCTPLGLMTVRNCKCQIFLHFAFNSLCTMSVVVPIGPVVRLQQSDSMLGKLFQLWPLRCVMLLRLNKGVQSKFSYVMYSSTHRYRQNSFTQQQWGVSQWGTEAGSQHGVTRGREKQHSVTDIYTCRDIKPQKRTLYKRTHTGIWIALAHWEHSED